ncbi:MAG: DUF1592 domain-containing protein, partial [Gammaproteobacteria bacterium]
MKRQREFLAVTIILAAALFSTGAQASRSTIEGGMLYVPRIDVDGFGALELTFRIVYDGEYQLLLEAADQASQAISSSGVFDPVALTIDVDEIELESGDLYAVQLVLMSQDPQVVFGIGNATHLNPQQNDPPNSGSQDPDPQAVSQYNQLCAGCHAVDGSGTAVAPSLSACSNCGSVSGLSNYIRDTMPLGNAGGCDSACASLLADYIMLAFNGSNQQVSTQTIGFIQTMGNGDALRRAAQQLVSRLPTLAEFQLAATGTDGLRSAVQGMMTEDGFYDRLAEIFNDYLLTDKYHSRNGSDHAIRLLSRDEFPSLYWFDPDKNNRSENFEDVRRATNNGVAREPLALINHVVRNNLPFTEILTADYFMVNPFSAKSYGVENQVAFSDPNNPDEFRPARLQDIPHAGVLTSPMFLNRYPTTETNRNRGRARVVFDLFLDTDILAIEGVRPGNAVDITTPIPTINNPQCSKCHSVLDPVASIFQNWDYKGRYRPSRESKHGWYTDMEPRGFNGEVMPLAGNVDSSVRWLAARMAQDPKFPRAVTRILVNGLTGKEPLQAPSDGDQLAMDAYVAERTLLNDMQSDFVAEGYNLKSLVTEIVLSPYWRAAGL